MQPAHYELVQLLGEGGMGLVYRAVHWPTGASVAVKTLRSEVRADALRRRYLLDEATAAAKLDDPRIVRLLDVGRDEEDAPFLVMELAEGRGLDQWLDEWPGWTAISRALLDVLEGLRAAHAVGIVHCDLKPANVMVDLEVGARILDFGVAALLDPLRDDLTEGIRGTPEFMPFEQLAGTGPLGPWCDLYAFGVILAHAVRGGSPFGDAESLPKLLHSKATYVAQEPFPVREGLDVPPALQGLIERLLAPHPRGRPRFAAEVQRELAALCERVVDRVPRRVVAEPSTGPRTTVDPVPARALELDPARTLPPRLVHVLSHDPREALSLPARLPAPPDIARGAALLRLREVPLVGRLEERAELERLVEVVRGGGGAQLLALVGEAGIGKSRLARWGLGQVERAGAMEGAAGGYDPSGADLAGGLRHALRRLIGEPKERWELTWSWLSREPGLDLALLSKFLGADKTSSTLSVETVARLAHGTLRAIGRTRPVYLWLDNLAWARDGALELVERLLEADDVPILIVATMRDGSLEHARVQARFAHLFASPRAHARYLGVLGHAERAALLREVAPLAPRIADELADHADGSPLLLVQLVLDWVARGFLREAPDGLAPDGGRSVAELLAARPLAALVEDRIRELLAELGELAPLADAILGRAALLGAQFEHAALRAACSRNARLLAVLDKVLDRALLVGMLRSEHARVYAFDHAMVHEAFVARAQEGPERRAALVDAANGLQACYGKERADIAALIAGLLWQAGDHERAWDRQLRAIQRASWANDDAAARAQLAVAREWLAEAPERRAQLELAEALVHYFGLRYDEALAAIARARTAGAEAQDPLLTMRCDATEADVLFFLDRFADAQRLAERCAVAGSDDDPEQAAIRAQAQQRLGELAALRGDLESALEWRRRGWVSSQAAGSAWRTRVMRLNAAEVLGVMGRVDEALALCAIVEDEARVERDEAHVEAAREDAAYFQALAGSFSASRDQIEARALGLEVAGDAYRFTRAAAFRALLAAETEDDETLAVWTRKLVAAFRAVPHDEIATTTAMRRVAGRLEERGRFELAHEVDALLKACRDRYQAGFARASDPDVRPG